MNQQPYSAPPPVYNFFFGPRDQKPLEECSIESVNNTKVQNTLEILNCYMIAIFIFQLIIALLFAALVIWLALDPLKKNKCTCRCIGPNIINDSL